MRSYQVGERCCVDWKSRKIAYRSALVGLRGYSLIVSLQLLTEMMVGATNVVAVVMLPRIVSSLVAADPTNSIVLPAVAIFVPSFEQHSSYIRINCCSSRRASRLDTCWVWTKQNGWTPACINRSLWEGLRLIGARRHHRKQISSVRLDFFRHKWSH